MIERFGIDLSRIQNECDCICWDIDGTLSTFAYGLNGANACDESDLYEYMRTHDAYANAVPCRIIREFIRQRLNDKKHFVISKCTSVHERRSKESFIEREYGIWIPRSHTYFVKENRDKLVIMHEILKKEGTDKIAIVDDNMEVLAHIQEKSTFKTLHVSSFLNSDL